MIWLQLICTEPETWRRTIVKSLSKAGVNVAERTGERRCPGIIFFDSPGAEVVTSVRELSHGGVDRVLALATTGAALATGFAWHLLQAGASDVFAWDHTDCVPAEIAARLERWEEVDTLVASPAVREHLAGRSSVWISTVRQVSEVAAFSGAPSCCSARAAPARSSWPRLIHALDRRPDKGELVVLDCTTVVPELSGSEFFGHERGAFTGAVAPRDGAFALADGGTLFLDEVGELPPGAAGAAAARGAGAHLQARRGQHLATHRVPPRLRHQPRPRRGRRARPVPRATSTTASPAAICRLAAAARAAGGHPRRWREHFLASCGPDGRAPELRRTPCREYLLSRDYPGNVRDLRQLVERIGDRHVGPGPITVGDIPEDEMGAAAAAGSAGEPMARSRRARRQRPRVRRPSTRRQSRR